MTAGIDFKKVFELVEIRESYCRNAKPCPKCKTDQVQLTEYRASHANWKCRLCSHRWITKGEDNEI